MNEIVLLTLDTAMPNPKLVSTLIVAAMMIGAAIAIFCSYATFSTDNRYTHEYEWFMRRNAADAPLPNDIVRLRRTRNITAIVTVIGLVLMIGAMFAHEPIQENNIARATTAVEGPLIQQADELATTRAQFYTDNNVDEVRLCSTASLAHPLHGRNAVVHPNTLIQCGGTNFGRIVYTLPESTNELTITSTYTPHKVRLNIAPGNLT